MRLFCVLMFLTTGVAGLADTLYLKNGNTRIDTLRQTYGDDFAAGMRRDAHLRTLLDRTGSSSLSDYLRQYGKK